ncbi:hypothetical protein KKF91_05815 [Myxococcota bacterium]|nr:hypothetical protein [Myxococcota bacterium]MBU1430067.1 hypothetical protein [Myxococcota bacterium]MBU1896292.1 hypothetical protein [Myxococcota bacterium]
MDLLGERARPDAGWRLHSGGAFIRVESEVDHLFERLVVVIIKPEGLDAATFQRWVKARVDTYHRYLEGCNLGRRLHLQTQTKIAVVILTRRLGHDPTDIDAALPSPRALLERLKAFTLDLERHMSALADPDLKHLAAIRTYSVPQRRGAYVRLGLDNLPYLIGHDHPPSAIDPISLFRGVAEELLERVEAKRGDLRGRRRLQRVRVLLAEIDAGPTNLRRIRRRIGELQPRPAWPWLLLLLLSTLSLAWLMR